MASPMGGDLHRLVHLIDEALTGLSGIQSSEINVPSAIMRRARRLLGQFIGLAREWHDLAAEPWGNNYSTAAQAQDSLNSHRFLVQRAVDPRDEWQEDEINAFTEAVESAIIKLAPIPLPLPHGIPGRTRRDDAIDRIVLAVCVYRAEQGLTVHYDFDPRTCRSPRGAEKGNNGIVDSRDMPNDTAALAAKALELWNVRTSIAQLRTALRNCGKLAKDLGRPLQIADLAEVTGDFTMLPQGS